MVTRSVQMKFYDVQNATSDENLHENERIRVNLGYSGVPNNSLCMLKYFDFFFANLHTLYLGIYSLN